MIMDRRIVESVRKLKGYRKEIEQVLSSHFGNVVVGRPYRMDREETALEMVIYSDAIENSWDAREMPELKDIIRRAKEDGYSLVLLFEDKEAIEHLPETGYKAALSR
jgi:hypothetical protein